MSIATRDPGALGKSLAAPVLSWLTGRTWRCAPSLEAQAGVPPVHGAGRRSLRVQQRLWHARGGAHSLAGRQRARRQTRQRCRQRHRRRCARLARARWHAGVLARAGHQRARRGRAGSSGRQVRLQRGQLLVQRRCARRPAARGTAAGLQRGILKRRRAGRQVVTVCVP